MKTDGMTEVLPLSKKQKYACNIVMGAMFVAAGVILILAGTGVIDASVRKIAAPTVLFAFGTAVLVSAIIAKNALSMWIAGVIITCGLPSLISAVTAAGYGQLYPLYIGAPAIGCVFAIFYSEAKMPQIKGFLFFGVLAAIFALQSSGTCGWGLTAGLLAAFGGVCIIIYAVCAYFNREKENA